MKIIRAKDEGFVAHWSELHQNKRLSSALYQPFNARFYELMRPSSDFTDLSYIVADGVHSHICVKVTLEKNSEGTKLLSYMGLPAMVFENPSKDMAANERAQRLAREEWLKIMQETGAVQIFFQDCLENGITGFLTRLLLDHGGTAKPIFTQIVDLQNSEEILHRSMRKSYKSLINWGKNNLELRTLNQENITREDMNLFKQLHIEVAGRQTRPDETWIAQYDMVINREAFAILGFKDGSLVTAGLYPFSQTHCFYGVSASRRELFEFPLSHVVIWKAMLHAKEMGCHIFETGLQSYPRQGHPSDKEINISKFKIGFGGNTFARMNIHLETASANVS